MPIPSIFEKLFNRPARIEGMWPFPVSQAPDDLIEVLEDFQRLPAPLQQWIEKWGEEEVETLFDGQSSRFHDLYDDLCATGFTKGIHGWIAVISTPVLQADGVGGGCFSWGHYHRDLIFAQTADEVLAQAEAWAEAKHERATTKAREAKSNG